MLPFRMIRLREFVFGLVSVGGIAGPVLSQESRSDLQQVQMQGVSFQLPASLELKLVAAPPLVQWPIVGDWDSEGRLVLVESAGVQKNVAEQTKTKPHRMVRLVDDDGDGTFDRRIIAVERLGFPEGVLCLGNQILVATPPQIMSYIDRDGDGRCEEESVWFDALTLTGCANDLHGPYLGRDGWIYWCKGAFAEQRHQLPSGKELVSKASHIFRRRLEGGLVEHVMTGGMDNPVEMAITPEGERFFTSTFLQHSVGGKRDGMAHAVYGGVYGKDQPAIQGHLRTGPLMPIMTHLGPAAPSGLACLSGDQLIQDSGLFEDRGRFLAAAQFNLQRVSLHRLIQEGATFRTEDRDLLVGDRVEFHPTDVLEDADGSLLVFDTGGWYDLCCPSSGVDQEKHLGAIYRIQGKASKSFKDARAKGVHLSQDPSEAVQLLTDPRWWLRKKVMESLSSRKDAIPSLASLIASPKAPEFAKIDAIWTLCRIGDPKAMEVILGVLDRESPSLRQVALHSLSVHRWNAPKAIQKVLYNDPNPLVKRVAAEALGRLRNEGSVEALMQAIDRNEGDRVLDHSLLYAMIELEDSPQVKRFVASQSIKKQRAALLVLDQIKASELTAEDVFAQVLSGDDALMSVAVEILGHHPEWAESLGPRILRLRDDALLDSNARRALLVIASEWRERPELLQFAAEWIRSVNSSPVATQELLLETLRSMRLKELPAEWSDAAARWLSQSKSLETSIADWLSTVLIRTERHASLTQTIFKQLSSNSNGTKSENLKRALSLVGALPESSEGVSLELQHQIIDLVVSDGDDVELQNLAVKSLPRIKLQRSEAERLIQSVAQVAPLHLVTALSSIAKLADDSLDIALFEQLKRAPAARTIPTESISILYKNRSVKVRDEAKKAIDWINQPPAEIATKLQDLESTLPAGDPIRGFQVYRSAKAACSACHRMGHVGGVVGPELSRIGSSRTRRDLLEAILFPSIRLAQSYQPLRVLTSDGQVHNGLVKAESKDELELVTGPDREVRISKADIEQRLPSNLSIMPAGLDQVISPQDLADLIAFLESKR